ncbi:hypothetical protein Q1695_011743 [Nippostrongylus brasiliensis]|nr:hypothetical protein Q1695_011743 [Nippostrongylus brasiliensis]
MTIESDTAGVPLKKTQSEGRMTGSLAFAIFSVTLGSFQFGYHIGCVNAPGEMITAWIQESHQGLFNQTLDKTGADLTWSVAVSMFAVGGMFGGLISGWLADKVGRRGGLLYNNLFAFIAAAMMGLAKPLGVYPMIVLGRLFIGFYCGLTCIVPMYLAETSPTNLRGMLGSLHQLLVTISILVSQIFGLPYILGNTERWPLIFAFTVVPAVLQVITLPLIPESPKYTLCVRGQQEKATRDLKKLRGQDDVSAEIDMFREEAAASGAAAQQRPSMVDMFKGSLLWPMTIAIMMMLAQQLSGINVAMFYSTVIFKQAGLTNEGAVYATIGMGSVNVIMTVISVWLEKELHATDAARHSGSFSTRRARTPPPEKDKDSDASPHEGSDSGPKKDEGKQPQKELTPLPKTAPTPVTEVSKTPMRQSCPPTPKTAVTPEMEEKVMPKPQQGGDAAKGPGEKEEKKSPQDSLQKEKKGGTAMSLRKLKKLKDSSSTRATSRTNTLVKSGSSSGTGSGPESRIIHQSGSRASRRPSHLSPVFFTRSLMFATICASLSSFQFGYSIGSINAPRDMIIKWINISYKSMFNEPIGEEHAEWIMSAIVSAFPLGAAIGGISSGVLADTAGRRGSLFYTNIIAFLAAGLMGTAKFVGVYHMMILGRFVIGIYVGITVIVPMYLVEISPRDIRGFVGSFHQLLITISILCSQIFGLPQIFGQEELWPYIFGFHAVPAFLQVYTLPMIPESPKFTLCIRGEVEQARADLEILRGTRNVDDEVEALRAEAIAAMETFSDRLSMFDMFRDKYKWPTMVVVIMMFAQQTTGINAVMFYSSIIFKRILTNDEDAVYATVAVGVVNVLMTFPQMYLIDHPGCGRRPLLLSGAIGMIVSTALLTVSITLSYQGVPMGYQSAIVFVMLFVVSFATGPAAISWILASELFLTNARANGNAYMALTNWITSSIVGLTFPKLNEHLKQYSFLVFTFFNAAYFCFIWKYVPETSNRSIREINADLDRKSIRY